MLTRLNRRRIVKEEEEVDQGVLEDDMLTYYRGECKKKSSAVTMILYRMNVWKEDPVSDEYEGRKDLGVEIHEGGETYELPSTKLCVRKTSPPIYPYEFNYSYGVRVSVPVPPHCKITGSTYLDDYIWIENLDSKGTFVNGRRISSGMKHMLVDGDIIGLGGPHTFPKHFWGKDKEERGFVFKVKKLWTPEGDTDKDEPSVANRALNIAVVLNNILKFLSYDELKSARVVNKFWMDSASRLLFPRTCANFSKSDYGYRAIMINTRNIANWKIRSDEYNERVQSLVTERGLTVRKLSLTITVKSQEDVTKLDTLLSRFPNLEVLKLLIVRDRHCLLKFSTTFGSVKELTVEIQEEEEDEDNFYIWTTEIPKYDLVSLTKSFPNIKSFVECRFLSSVSSCLDRTGHPFYLWPNLTQISANCSDKVMEGIKTLPKTLTSLDLKGISWGGRMGLLNDVIERHSTTLEHLALQGHWYINSESLALPKCPKLKSLEVHFTETETYMHNGDLSRPAPKILFPSGSICYEEDFPELKTLSLMTLTRNPRNSNVIDELKVDVQSILDVFVPHDSATVCKTMRWVNFRLTNAKCRKASKNPWFKGFVERFGHTFPHVHHPQVNQGFKDFYTLYKQ